MTQQSAIRRWWARGKMFFLCAFVFAYIVAGAPALIYARLTGNARLALNLTWLLDRMVLFLAGVRLRVEGLEKLSKNVGYVYVGNHRSIVDVCVVFLALPGDVRFLAKKELFRVPLVSFAMRSMGMISVDRSNSEAAAQSIERAVTEIQSGKSIILFPEGTRSRIPRLLPFKKGAFVLAIKAQAPVIPVTIIGADKALPPDTMLLYGGTVRMIIHDPIETRGLELANRETLLKQARAIIETTYLKESQTAEEQRAVQASTIR